MKKTSKKVFLMAGAILAVIIIISVKSLSGITFNEKISTQEIDSKIKCVEVIGNILVDLYPEVKLPYSIDEPLDIELDDLYIKRYNDTIKIVFKGNRKMPQNAVRIIRNAISFSVKEIKYIKASKGANINLNCISGENATIIATDSSSVSFYTEYTPKNIFVRLADSAHVNIQSDIYFSEDEYLNKKKPFPIGTINADIKNKASLSINMPAAIINGSMKNKAYVELVERTRNPLYKVYNYSKLVAGDSSAVMYRYYGIK